MSFKKLALYTAALAAVASAGMDVSVPSVKRADPRMFGTSPKRCKSCVSFSWCKKSKGIRPMDVSCASYKRKKK